MKVSGFTYIRNGFTYGYPFLEAFSSILPLVDELVVAVGESTDGTREAVAALGPKVKIIDTVWDDNLREGGKIFAQQANIALDQISGDWAFHIQADELIHEDAIPVIRSAMEAHYKDDRVEGLLFRFLNFYGGYKYIGTTRRWHRAEVRIIRNWKNIRSFRDSQGFRIYPNPGDELKGNSGRPLRVKKVDADIFHYSYARDPKSMKKKANYFHSFWHDDKWLNENLDKSEQFDFHDIDDLTEFKGTHPELMKEKIAAQDWTFNFDPSKAKFSPKGKLLHWVEKNTGWRIGEYKNYKVI